MDLRKINTLIADDYTNKNDSVSTLSDAPQDLAGKSLFCKLTVCRWRTTGQWNLLAFNFATEVFDYRRLPQGLSRSVSAFSSFMREYLDPVVKADQYAQYVHDIIIAANNDTDLTPNIRAVFHCFCQAGLKLTIEKCVFVFRQVEFLGRPFSSGGYQHKLTRFKNS